MASSFVDSAAARQLAQAIDWQLANVRDDAALRTFLEGVATQRAFGGMTWHWGPKLYARNRAMFGAFIAQHFSDTAQVGEDRFPRIEPIKWAGAQAAALDAWLAEVDRADDARLFRRLYAWKWREKRGWGIDQKRWAADLVERFAAADTSARRAQVFEKFDQPWVSLDEASARRLYAIDPTLSEKFILGHLPHRSWRDNADNRWHALIAEAESRGDRKFARALYRRQVPLKGWRDDVLALARQPLATADLLEALDERHPEGLWSDLGPVFVALLEARGTDVLPYVQKHLQRVRSQVTWFGNDSATALAKLANQRGWVDFRIAVLVKCAQPKAFNEAVRETLDDRALDEQERMRRLALFSGVSREWNYLGFGLAAVQQLDEKLAVQLYTRHPELLRTHFKAHVTPAWREKHLALFELAFSGGDDELSDHLASRYATLGMWRADASELAPAERVADLLVGLKLEPAAFARRAASILTRIPSFAIRDYPRLVRHNRLARLLFERSLGEFLADDSGRAIRDLVEGAEIHVQRLAYRVLGARDPRAPALAAENLEILLGTLLRPLHRETRAQAFGALLNAAREEPGARRVLDRAREAFALPDDGYPKEGLLGLVAAILARHPQLAAHGEARVVYRKVPA